MHTTSRKSNNNKRQHQKSVIERVQSVVKSENDDEEEDDSSQQNSPDNSTKTQNNQTVRVVLPNINVQQGQDINLTIENHHNNQNLIKQNKKSSQIYNQNIKEEQKHDDQEKVNQDKRILNLSGKFQDMNIRLLIDNSLTGSQTQYRLYGDNQQDEVITPRNNNSYINLERSHRNKKEHYIQMQNRIKNIQLEEEMQIHEIRDPSITTYTDKYIQRKNVKFQKQIQQEKQKQMNNNLVMSKFIQFSIFYQIFIIQWLKIRQQIKRKIRNLMTHIYPNKVKDFQKKIDRIKKRQINYSSATNYFQNQICEQSLNIFIIFNKNNNQYQLLQQLPHTYQIPPDWNQAREHGMSRKVSTERQNEEAKKVCPCCGYEVNRDNIPIGIDTMKLSFLGSGYPLFFYFVKSCIVLLTGMLIILGFPVIYLNSQGLFCWRKVLDLSTPDLQKMCFNDNITNYSMINTLYNDTLMQNTEYFNALFVFFTIGMLIYIRTHFLSLETELDENFTSSTDFSLIFKNIPRGKNQQNQMKDFKDFLESFGARISKICPIYDMQLYNQAKDNLDNTVNDLQDYLKAQEFKEFFNQKVIDETNLKEAQIIRKLKELDNSRTITMTRSQYFTGKVIVSFMTEDDKDKIFNIKSNQEQESHYLTRISKFFRKMFFETPKQVIDPNVDKLIFKNHLLIVKKISEPTDII